MDSRAGLVSRAERANGPGEDHPRNATDARIKKYGSSANLPCAGGLDTTLRKRWVKADRRGFSPTLRDPLLPVTDTQVVQACARSSGQPRGLLIGWTKNFASQSRAPQNVRIF